MNTTQPRSRLSLLAAAVLLGAAGAFVPARAATVNMLWNHQLGYRSWVQWNQDGERPAAGCDMSQGNLTGSPAGSYQCLMADGSYVKAPNGSQPSVRWVSLNFTNDQYKKYPGYDMWVTGSGYGSPIEFMFANSSKTSTTGGLNEVGFVFEHWPLNAGKWAFREQFRVGHFSKIMASMQARLKGFSASGNATWRTAYVTADFRINYYDADGTWVRNDLLGVILSNPNNYDHTGTTSDVYYYKSGTHVLLHGNKLGIPTINTPATTDTAISFDYLPLIKTYLPPPPAGLTYNDAVVDGWDVYSSTMLADMSFYLKAPALVGTRP